MVISYKAGSLGWFSFILGRFSGRRLLEEGAVTFSTTRRQHRHQTQSSRAPWIGHFLHRAEGKISMIATARHENFLSLPITGRGRVGPERSGGRSQTSVLCPGAWHLTIALFVVLRQLPHAELGHWSGSQTRHFGPKNSGLMSLGGLTVALKSPFPS